MKSIQFCVKAQVQFGQAVYLVNSQNEWHLNQSSRMQWVSVSYFSKQKGSKWQILLNVSQSLLEYKYIITDFDLSRESKITWERGTNRILRAEKLKKLSRNDKWESRRVLVAYPKIIDNSMMILIGDRLAPKKMKTIQIQGQPFFYLTVYLDILNENQVYNFQYYLLHYGKQPREFVSSSHVIPISEEPIQRIDDVPFFQIKNI